MCRLIQPLELSMPVQNSILLKKQFTRERVLKPSRHSSVCNVECLSGCQTGYQEVSRCCTRGESQKHVTCTPLPSVNKAAHSGFETKHREDITSGPTKRTYVLQKLKKKSSNSQRLHLLVFTFLMVFGLLD